MKLDKRHLVAALALLVGSIIYNVWVFTRPPAGASAAGTPIAPIADTAAPAAGAPVVAAQLNPSQVTPLPEVELDRLPEWRRNPFANPRAPEAAVVTAAPAPIQEADPVVATILYSTDRRLAMVDGRIVRVGDRLGDATIIDIVPDAVIVESPARGRRSLSLRPTGTGVVAR